ncbi:MAG: tetratricopeptide repeat protein [Elainellaceae cyanobacterium]
MLKFLKNSIDKPSPQTLGGRYQVIRRLAAGGFGQTFLARDRHLPGHPICVVKQLQPRFSDAASLKTARRLFDTEAQVLYDLGHHPQIPRLMAHFEEDAEFYLAQEYVAGEPLEDVLVNGRPWQPGRVMAMLQDILQVLAFVHEKNVIHRDIKPSNLLCRRQDGHIVLIDFGAVKQVNTGLAEPQSGRTNLTVSIGTQGYMPSEQLSGQPRFSSDVYAVGMVAIQALTGVRPQDLAENPHTGEVAWREANSAVASTLDSDLATLIDRMVYYDFRARYSDAGAALEALAALPPALRDTMPERWYAPEAAPEVTHEGDRPASAHYVAPRLRPSGEPTEAAVGGSAAWGTEGSQNTTAIAPSASIFAGNRGWILGGVAAVLGLALLPMGVGRLRQVEQSAPSRAADPPAEQTVAEAVSEQPARTAAADSATEGNAENVPAEPAATPDWVEQADALRQQGQYPEALDTYAQAIAADPNSAQAHWGKCYSLNRLMQPEAAIAACDQALALDPNHADALSSKGYALQLQGLQEPALMLFNRAIASDPNHVDALANRGAALLALKRPQEALASLDRAIAVQADRPEAWNNRAAALWAVGQRSGAVESVEKALALKPDYAEAQALRQQMRDRGY